MNAPKEVIMTEARLQQLSSSKREKDSISKEMSHTGVRKYSPRDKGCLTLTLCLIMTPLMTVSS